ncbi:hypothetical protein [Variovorax sp. LT1R16]|uniref:hypothetical protein n=1 Tax=Variovorax sp. LT1R16 TaxID=3443728 RepID=UPI003F45D198
METSLVQASKLVIVSATGLSKDALHLYAGLSVFLIVAAITRKQIASWLPWSMVFAVAVTAEFLDMRDDVLSLGYWRWAASLHDLVNTIFWPTVFFLLARSTGILSKRS